MNTCRTCRRDLVEGEGTVCDSCDITSFDTTKRFDEELPAFLQQHLDVADHFSRCRTTAAIVSRWMTEGAEMVAKVVADYVRTGGAGT